ncbi:MAG: hypothetical protein ABSE16_07770 [Verrucomicrobiota bacterium]|jgi:hypothetical protein
MTSPVKLMILVEQPEIEFTQERRLFLAGFHGTRFVAAFAPAAAELLQPGQDHEDGDGDPEGLVAQYFQRPQQHGHTNQDDEHGGHFMAEATALFRFTALFLFGRFHNEFLSFCGFQTKQNE